MTEPVDHQRQCAIWRPIERMPEPAHLHPAPKSLIRLVPSGGSRDQPARASSVICDAPGATPSRPIGSTSRPNVSLMTSAAAR